MVVILTTLLLDKDNNKTIDRSGNVIMLSSPVVHTDDAKQVFSKRLVVELPTQLPSCYMEIENGCSILTNTRHHLVFNILLVTLLSSHELCISAHVHHTKRLA